MRDPVFEKFLRRDPEALPRVKSDGLALGLDADSRGTESLPDFLDPGIQQLPAEPGSTVHSQHAAYLQDAGLLHERAEVGGDPSIVLIKDVQTLFGQSIDILIRLPIC